MQDKRAKKQPPDGKIPFHRATAYLFLFRITNTAIAAPAIPTVTATHSRMNTCLSVVSTDGSITSSTEGAVVWVVVMLSPACREAEVLSVPPEAEAAVVDDPCVGAVVVTPPTITVVLPIGLPVVVTARPVVVVVVVVVVAACSLVRPQREQVPPT